MRIVLDTNVVVAGLLWDGTPRQLLQAARERRLNLFTSTVLLLELADVLGREKFGHKLATAQLSVDQLVERYGALATVIQSPTIEPVIVDDPDDDHVLACATAAKADVIVSGDRDLLTLKQYEQIRILTAAEAILSIPA